MHFAISHFMFYNKRQQIYKRTNYLQEEEGKTNPRALQCATLELQTLPCPHIAKLCYANSWSFTEIAKMIHVRNKAT